MIRVAVAKPSHSTHLAQHALDGTLPQVYFESKMQLHCVNIIIFVTQFYILSFCFKVCFGVPVLLFVSKCQNESLHSGKNNHSNQNKKVDKKTQMSGRVQLRWLPKHLFILSEQESTQRSGL